MTRTPEYMITFLITGSHIDAEIADAAARRLLRPIYCEACGDEIVASDDVIDGLHAQCAEACADIGYAEAQVW